MPRCEICRREQTRRIRDRDTGKLVCYSCGSLLRNPLYAVNEVHRKDKIIEQYSREYTIKKADIKHRFNSPFSAIPPIHVLENAVLALDVEGKYSSFPIVLSDYYGIDSPPFYVDSDKVPENAVACYYRQTNTVYSKGVMGRTTAFHEIWHALESFGVVPYDPKTSERDADRYAHGCKSRLENNKRKP